PTDIPLDAVTAPQSATYFFCTPRSVKFSVGKTYSVLRQVIQHHSTADDFAISASKIEGEAPRGARNLRVSRQNAPGTAVALTLDLDQTRRAHDLDCRGRDGDRRILVVEGAAQPEGRRTVARRGDAGPRARVNPRIARGSQDAARGMCRARPANDAGGVR